MKWMFVVTALAGCSVDPEQGTDSTTQAVVGGGPVSMPLPVVITNDSTEAIPTRRGEPFEYRARGAAPPNDPRGGLTLAHRSSSYVSPSSAAPQRPFTIENINIQVSAGEGEAVWAWVQVKSSSVNVWEDMPKRFVALHSQGTVDSWQVHVGNEAVMLRAEANAEIECFAMHARAPGSAFLAQLGMECSIAGTIDP